MNEFEIRDMLVVIPVVDEYDVNHLCGFRKVRTAGILTCEGEEDDPTVLCLNGASEGLDIADQIKSSGRDIDDVKVIFGERKEQSNEKA